MPKVSRLCLNALTGGAILVAMGGCAAPNQTAPMSKVDVPKAPSGVEEVATLLEGTMDSSAQAMRRRDFRDVRITHCRLPSDPGQPQDGSVMMYVEQGMSLDSNRPYRQRLMRLTAGEGDTVVSSIFKPAVDPVAFVGLCDKPLAERKVKPTDFGAADCHVILRRTTDGWAGASEANGCPNNHRGAVLATSEVKLGPTGMTSWDRGWDAEGKQAWGSVPGPYEFVKYSPGANDAEINAVAQRLSGQSDSFKQAAADPQGYMPLSFNNCPLHLEGSTFPATARVILIDQRADLPKLKFNRVRFLVVQRAPDGKSITTANYSLKDASRYAGLCAKPAEQHVAQASDIAELECEMRFRREGNDFVGGTDEPGCKSNYRGASRLVVSATLSEERFLDWERWYNDAGALVAGAEKGPYIFEVAEKEK
jgi:hypothetical protein